MDEIIKLQCPITVAGSEVTELTMRRPKLRDLLATEKEKTVSQQEVLMFANLCGLAPSDLHELDIADFRALQQVYVGFLSQSQTTSGEPV